MKRRSMTLRVLAELLAVGFFARLAIAETSANPKPLTVDTIRESTSRVDDAELRKADQDKNNWLSYGRTYSEQRFSPLDQINAKNVDKLGLVWSYALGSNRGVEATPIVVDGVMFVTAPWSIVFALDARNGKELWRYDPKVPKEWGQNACCDVVNRGVAVYKGKVYVGTLDARLVALDAATGKVVWEERTTEKDQPYTITGAPRIAAGKVLIGNGGAEYGVRGYVSAYDAENGKLAWRTFTVPGDPAKPFESEAIEEAAKTWKRADAWLKHGAGGTVWDAITYDPELNLIYFGTGNGVAWDRDERSPGGGDNLYLTSILAVFADTGKVRWHYQLAPGDTWDYDACQQLMLADLKIKGKNRKVLMQAPKVGFFYIWDRETGELLSAEKYADKVTWAKKVDLKTGKPVEADGVRYKDGQSVVWPGPNGAHNWHPMSYSPKTGLVYIPAQENPAALEKDPEFKSRNDVGAINLGIKMTAFKGLNRTIVSGHLLAWDPVKGKEAWRVPHSVMLNGGTLATAGNLVFQGTGDGHFVAYTADKGEKLWEAPAGTGVIAAPMSYMVDGVQYVTIAAGWGGGFALHGGDAAAAAGVKSIGNVWTFALGGRLAATDPPEIVKGEKLYHDHCVICHGAAAVGGGVLPDLRHMNPDVQKVFPQIVKNGIPGTGMAPFGKWVSDDDAKLILQYIRKRAEDEKAGD